MTQMQNNTRKQKFHWLIVFLYIVWIFSNSLMNGEISSGTSGNLTRQLLAILSSMGIHLSFDFFHHLIRKTAHFCEYALLGLLVTLCNRKKPLFSSSKITTAVFCIIPPLMDECLQLFIPGRSGALTDSLLDMCGYAFGALFTLCMMKLMQKFTGLPKQ
ncbi:MAG: VanZ family protein [Bulleidia sp.]